MAKWQRWGKVTAITAAVVAVTLGTGGVLVSGAAAGAAPGGFAQRPAAATTPGWAAAGRTKSPVGGYEIFENGEDMGRMLLNTDQSVSFLGNGDDGLWVKTGSSIAISITSSSGDDTGCTFSGVIGKKELNSPKKQGNYVCPGDEGVNFQWYAPFTFD
jgi:hypothetical protein